MIKLICLRTSSAICLAATLLTVATASAAPTSVQLNVYNASLRGTQSVTFQAVVSNATTQTVTWSVNGIQGGNSTVGTITTDGVYTAPEVAPSLNTVSVTAVSYADPSASATAAVSIFNPIPVITGLSLATIISGRRFTEQISGVDFVPTSMVGASDGTPLTIISQSETQITVSGTSWSPGNTLIVLQVSNPDPGASSSSAAVAVANQVSITVWPTTYTVRTGASFPFGVSVENTTNAAVTWSVNGIVGGNTSIGTITAGGIYTAPSIAPAATVSVSATSLADPTKSASGSVTIDNPIPSIGSVATSLGTQTVVTDMPFTAVIRGSNFLPSSTVSISDGTRLSVVSQSAAEITVTGTSSSPAGTLLNFQVSNPNPGASTSNIGQLTVVAQVTLVIWPTTVTVRGLASQSFISDVEYSANRNVTWFVNGIEGGNSSVGTIGASGVYTAPAMLPASTVMVMAQSVADPTKSASGTVTLLNPIPVVSGATSPVTAGGNAAITIRGSSFAQSATVQLAGAPMRVSWISSSQLLASGPVNMPVGGMLPLVVSNPDPGASVSNQIAISIQNPGTQLSYAQAKHFLEQATWGPTPDSIAHLQSIGISSWLTEQFDPTATPESNYTPTDVETTGINDVQAQFYAHALTGADQLRQRVAFVLGQILVTSGITLNAYDQMEPYQQLLLDDAFGTYSNLVHDVTLSPAMGNYLDMVNNAIATSSASPNENYARELMQLFTIGLTQLNADGSLATGSPVPTFSENDVLAMSRVLTGWTFAPCGGASQWPNAPCYSSPMVAFESQHDNGVKTVLGTNIQTGSAEGDLNAALAILTTYQNPQSTVPNIAPFVSLRLIQHLVTGNPDPAYVARVSAVFASSGGNLQQVVTAILTDPSAALGNPGHLREPDFFEVSLVRALQVQFPSDFPFASAGSQMGQNVFFPETVFNYYSPFYSLAGSPIIAPEFQILTEPAAIQRCDWAYWTAHSDLFVNFADLTLDTNPSTQSAGITAMLNAVSQALLGTAMPGDMMAAIMPAMVATTNATTRAQNAVFLVGASPQYQVQQ